MAEAKPTEVKQSAKDFVHPKAQLEKETDECVRKMDKLRYKQSKFIKNAYKELSPNSKMFAIEYQLAPSRYDQNELVNICVVDEDLKVIYKSLVKPTVPIVFYPTIMCNGVDAEKLKNVTTTMADVQKFLCEHLPDDAILIGRCMCFLLLALKLKHPYIIDTTVIYEDSDGIYKTKELKRAYKRYYDMSMTLTGLADGPPVLPDPEQDALAAMKLMKVRVEKGPLPPWAGGKKTGKTSSKSRKSKKSSSSQKSSKEPPFENFEQFFDDLGKMLSLMAHPDYVNTDTDTGDSD